MSEQPPIPEPGEGAPSSSDAPAPAASTPQPVVPVASHLAPAQVASTEYPATSFDGAAVSPIDRPEVAVGAAFAGGLLLALILRRLAR